MTSTVASVDSHVPETMTAARLDRGTGRLALAEIPVPDVGPGMVLVRIRACGVCLSDIHLIDGMLASPLQIITPGHEPAGIVAAVGSGVTRWAAGNSVVIDAGVSCGTCWACAKGMTEDCDQSQIMGVHYDGAWAQYVAVPQTTLAVMPSVLSFPEAAVTADAVSTPYAALIDTAGLRPSRSVGLWGIGGLGFHAVAIARLAGAAPIVAFDPNPAARARSMEAGADLALDPRDPVVASRVAAATSGRGLDVAIDLVGSNQVLRQASSLIGRRGRVVAVGLSNEEVRLGTSEEIAYRGMRFEGHLGYRRRHLEQVLNLIEHGRLDLSRSVSARYPLSDVEAAVEHLRSKRGDPIRIILEP